MPDNSLDAILTGANNFMTQAASAGNELFDISMRQAVVASEDAGLAKTVGANLQIIDGAKQNAELATQNAKIAGANALGTNLKAQGEVLTGLSADVLDLMRQKKESLAVIRKKQSVGLLDDPLSYIFNAISLPDDIAKHNAINEELVSTQENIQKLNQLSQGTIATQNQLTESITQAGIKASADNIASVAQMNANKATREALGYNAQGIQSVLNANTQIVSTRFQAQNAINAQQHIDIALANLELHRKEFDWRKEEKKIADDARAKNNDVDDYTLGKVNEGLKRMGIAEIPMNSPKAGNILQMIKSGAASGSIFEMAYKIAMNSEMMGPNAPTILAPSPSAAAELLYKVPGLKLPSAMEPVKDLIHNATAVVKERAAQPGSTIDPKNKQSVDAAIDQAAKELLSEQAKVIKPGDKSNVFQLPSMGALINSSPPLQSLPVVQKLLMPAIATGVDVSDFNTVFGMGMKAISENKLSYQEWIGITQVYQRAVATNLEAKQLQSLGLNLSPKSASDPSIFSYRTQVQTAPGKALFGSKQIIDATNPFDISRATLKYQMEISNQNPGGLFFQALESRRPSVPPTNIKDINRGLLGELFKAPGEQ